MSYLLDTNVISEMRRKSPDSNVLAWLDGVDQKELFISVLTIGELSKGIARRRLKDPEMAESLQHWLRGIETFFADHVIGINTAIAMDWGAINDGRSLPVIDSLLAATARVRKLTLVTRNVRDIEPMNVPCFNPWSAA